MCNTIYLSTTSNQDLSALSGSFFQIAQPTTEELEFAREYLRYPHVWSLLGPHGDCSCHFRHLMVESSSLGFGGREDWFGEDDDDVNATQAVYDTFKILVDSGEKIDLIDGWNHEMTDDWESIDVSLAEVTRDTFRFFEDFRFELTV